MTFKFKMTRRDFFYAFLLMNFQQPFLIALLTLFSIYILYSNWTITESEYIIIRLLVTVILCIPPFLTVLGLISLYIALMTFSKNNAVYFLEQNWVVNEDMIVYQTEYFHSQIKWGGVKRITVNGNYIFVYFSQMGACVIPKHALPSDQEWKALIGLFRSKLNKK